MTLARRGTVVYPPPAIDFTVVVDPDGNEGDVRTIADAVALLPSQGGRIILREGTHNVSATITIDKPVQIEGPLLSETNTLADLQSTNAVIQVAAGIKAFTLTDRWTFTIQDVNILGTGAANETIITRPSGAAPSIYFRRCSIQDFEKVVEIIAGSPGPVTFEDCENITPNSTNPNCYLVDNQTGSGYEVRMLHSRVFNNGSGRWGFNGRLGSLIAHESTVSFIGGAGTSQGFNLFGYNSAFVAGATQVIVRGFDLWDCTLSGDDIQMEGLGITFEPSVMIGGNWGGGVSTGRLTIGSQTSGAVATARGNILLKGVNFIISSGLAPDGPLFIANDAQNITVEDCSFTQASGAAAFTEYIDIGTGCIDVRLAGNSLLTGFGSTWPADFILTASPVKVDRTYIPAAATSRLYGVTGAGQIIADNENTQTLNTSTALDDTHFTTLIDASGGTVTLTLPAANKYRHKLYRIKLISVVAAPYLTNTVIINASGGALIDGGSQYNRLKQQYDEVTLLSDGTNWNVVAERVSELVTSTPIRTETAALFVVANAGTLLADATAAPQTARLGSPASTFGNEYTIKKIDATANTVTVQPGTPGPLIDGAPNYVLTTQYQSITVKSDGSNWWII